MCIIQVCTTIFPIGFLVSTWCCVSYWRARSKPVCSNWDALRQSFPDKWYMKHPNSLFCTHPSLYLSSSHHPKNSNSGVVVVTTITALAATDRLILRLLVTSGQCFRILAHHLAMAPLPLLLHSLTFLFLPLSLPLFLHTSQCSWILMYCLWLKYLFTILHSIGVYDSSGIVFSYTATRPENIAGILTVGSTVNYQLLIPPNANNYTVSALCSADCTQRVCEWCWLI